MSESDMFETDDEYEEDDDGQEIMEPDSDSEYETEEEEEAAGPADDTEGDREEATSWQAPSSLPGATWDRIERVIQRLQDSGRNELTVVVMGKPGTGVSSTVNALLGEKLFDVRPSFGIRPAQGTKFAELSLRKHNGFLLRIVHTRWLVNNNQMNRSVLEAVAKELNGRHVDVLLWADRLDSFRVEDLDHRIWKSIDRHLPELLSRAALVLTHGATTQPRGYSFEDFVEKRQRQLLSALQKYGSKDTPVAVVEHGSRSTQKNGERVLPDDSVWHERLFNTLATAALRQDTGKTLTYEKWDPGRVRKWIAPSMLVAQIAFKFLVLDRVFVRDGRQGDHDGPFKDTEKIQAQLQREREEELSRPPQALKDSEEPVILDQNDDDEA